MFVPHLCLREGEERIVFFYTAILSDKDLT